MIQMKGALGRVEIFVGLYNARQQDSKTAREAWNLEEFVVEPTVLQQHQFHSNSLQPNSNPISILFGLHHDNWKTAAAAIYCLMARGRFQTLECSGPFKLLFFFFFSFFWLLPLNFGTQIIHFPLWSRMIKIRWIVLHENDQDIFE